MSKELPYAVNIQRQVKDGERVAFSMNISVSGFNPIIEDAGLSDFVPWLEDNGLELGLDYEVTWFPTTGNVAGLTYSFARLEDAILFKLACGGK